MRLVSPWSEPPKRSLLLYVLKASVVAVLRIHSPIVLHQLSMAVRPG